jgi:acetyl-CoA carboxylase biotin carboxyl carrier protein
MLSYEQILDLIEKLVETPLSEISIAQGEFSVSLKKENQGQAITQSLMGLPTPIYAQPAPMPASVTPPVPAVSPTASSNLIEVTSPMVGSFYSAASPDSPVFVEVGKKIKTGDTLCIIEAMKVMNELPAEISGTIEEICVKNSQTVEFGQVLFRVKPD